MILLITYDLHEYGRDYPKVQAALSRADSFIHPMGSVWLVDTLLDASEWQSLLLDAVDANDEFFITPLKPSAWASFNFDQSAVTWLNSQSRRW